MPITSLMPRTPALALALALIIMGIGSQVAASPAPSFNPGEVVAQLNRLENYPEGQRPTPEADGAYKSITVLTGGRIIVFTDDGDVVNGQIAPRNQMEIELLGQLVAKAPIFSIDISQPPPANSGNTGPRNMIVLPNTRGELRLAKYDWRTKLWSEPFVVWLEEGEDYPNQTRPKNDFEYIQAHSLVGRLETLAYEASRNN